MLVHLRVKDGGSSRAAFDTIVAFDPDGALPRARPVEGVLEPDGLVVLDFGGVYDGYCVDPGRTISLGSRGDDVFSKGLVFTIVPGVHRPGWGGIPSEDDVVVTAEGCRVLTPASRGRLER